MIEYEVILKRYKGSARSDVCIFVDEGRIKAINAMVDYSKKNGFTVQDSDGRFTIADIQLVETERISGKPPVSIKSYYQVYDDVTGKIIG